MSDNPVSYEEAVALATEIGESLGGRQQEALRVLMRYAARGRRHSSAVMAGQYFRNASEIATEVVEGLEPKKDDSGD